MRISEIHARILNEESNLCTNLNKPTQLHQDRNSKTYFDNYMVSLKHKSVKVNIKVFNLQLCLLGSFIISL